jgi:hypothetical protein
MEASMKLIKFISFFLCTLLCYPSYGSENEFSFVRHNGKEIFSQPFSVFDLAGDDLETPVKRNDENINCTTCNSNREDNHSIDLVQKIYLHTDQVSFHDSKIFVQLFDEVRVVPAVFSDQNGYYILTGKRCKSWQWTCDYCKKCNELEDYRCVYCGKGTN